MDQYSTVQTSPFKYFASNVNCIHCSTVEKEKKKKKERKKGRNKCRLKGRGEERKKEKARKKKERKKEKKRKEGVKERDIIMTIQLIKSHPSLSSFIFFSVGARNCIFLIQ